MKPCIAALKQRMVDMTVNEASLFVLAAVILIVGLYIDKYSEPNRGTSAGHEADD